YVMGVRGCPSADHAGLAGHIVQMLFATDPPRLTDCEYALVNFCRRALRRLLSRWGSCGVGLCGISSFGDGNCALFKVSNKLWRQSRFLQMMLTKTSVDRAHRFDILLPNGEQTLDVSSLAHSCAKGRGKLARLIESCSFESRF